MERLYVALTLHSLSFCSFRDLLCSCLPVSKRWHELLHDHRVNGCVWKHQDEWLATPWLCREFLLDTTRYMERHAWRLQYAHQLYWVYSDIDTLENRYLADSLRQLLTRFTQWKHIDLGDVRSVPLDALLRLPRLHTLELGDAERWEWPVSDDRAPLLVTSLQVLHYVGVPRSHAFPAQLLQYCPALQELHIHTPFPPTDVEEFAHAVRALHHLTCIGWTLELDKEDEAPPVITHKLASLRCLVEVPSLTSLQLEVSVHAYLPVRTALRHLLEPCSSRLQRLVLDVCVTDPGGLLAGSTLYDILHAVGSCHCLESLELAGSEAFGVLDKTFDWGAIGLLNGLGNHLKSLTITDLNVSLAVYQQLPGLFPHLKEVRINLPKETLISVFLKFLPMYRHMSRCYLHICSMINNTSLSAQQFVDALNQCKPTPQHRLLLKHEAECITLGWLPPDEPLVKAFSTNNETAMDNLRWWLLPKTERAKAVFRHWE